MQRIYNLSDVSFLADLSSYHQIMIVIKASSDTCLFEQGSVRIKTTSLAIHEEMCPKVLDDVDEIVVELRPIEACCLQSSHDCHPGHKQCVVQIFVIVQEVDICQNVFCTSYQDSRTSMRIVEMTGKDVLHHNTWGRTCPCQTFEIVINSSFCFLGCIL